VYRYNYWHAWKHNSRSLRDSGFIPFVGWNSYCCERDLFHSSTGSFVLAACTWFWRDNTVEGMKLWYWYPIHQVCWLLVCSGLFLLCRCVGGKICADQPCWILQLHDFTKSGQPWTRVELDQVGVGHFCSIVITAEMLKCAKSQVVFCKKDLNQYQLCLTWARFSHEQNIIVAFRFLACPKRDKFILRRGFASIFYFCKIWNINQLRSSNSSSTSCFVWVWNLVSDAKGRA
jgi:hypothetical protein